MGARSMLIGGPLCGRDLSQRGDPFLWVSVLRDEQLSLRASAKPTATGLLYRRLSDGHYIYAALTYRRCEACEGMESGSDRCSFCGGRLLPA